MPYKYKRVCPICQRPNVIHLSSHLEMVHELSARERYPYLKRAVLCPSDLINNSVSSSEKKRRIYPKHIRKNVTHCAKKLPSGKSNQLIIPEKYAEFRFRHKFSLMVVGPSMSGKSYFVKQMLEQDHIEYEDPWKQRSIHWFYGQYQDMFKDMTRTMGKDIYFKQGLPDFQPDLGDIDPSFNNIIVLDDLMDLAVDSPLISKLFTQGRHRNASVILLLQNAFPRGKYNTSISRNAQYMALFRCPADRRQIGIMADRIFDKNKPSFMKIYNDITSKPYTYVLVDNKADTPVGRQIIADIFGTCLSYTIPGVESAVHEPIKEQTITTVDVETYENKDDIFSKLLKRNDKQGPIVVHLNTYEWVNVQDLFRQAETGGNLPPGWILWRVYSVRVVDNYKPVLIKNPYTNETKYYRVCNEWLIAYYPNYRNML